MEKEMNASSGLNPITFGDGRTIYMTADQLIQANRESTRLGFNRKLSLPEDEVRKMNLMYAIAKAWRHVGLTEYIRVSFYFAVRRDGRGGDMLLLDITPDTWQEILANPAKYLK